MSRIVIGYLKSILLSILIIAAYSSTTFSQRKETITINGYECVKGEVIVKFKSYKNNSLIPQSMKGKENLLTQLNAKIAKKWKIGAELWRLTPDETEKAIDELKQNPLVEYVEPNYIITADVIPNDPSFVNLWGLNNTGQTGGTSDADIDAPEAWDITTGDSTIIVGVIDSGIDYSHPDLSANIWRNPQEIPDNGIDDDDNGYIDDYYGYDFVNKDSNPMDDHFHGTHVAGTIGAVANNKVGIAGVAWNVKIIALKYLDASGRGNTADAISAIEYATRMGAKITNNSWGGSSYSQALYDAIAAAGNAGVLFVAAAGNDGVDNDFDPHYPASYDLPNIISVAATNHDDDLSSFSNWGFNSVDLAAPGSNIFSTLPGGGYGEKSGTSMAAPHVSGALVLIWSAFPAYTSVEIKQQLINSVDRIPALTEKSVSNGRLNVYNAVAGDNRPPMEITPRQIDFKAILVGAQSDPEEIVITNITDQVISIDSIKVEDGFLLRRNDNDYANHIDDFKINPGQQEAISVIFKPATQQYYSKYLSVFYSNSNGAPKELLVFLKGAGFSSGTVITGGYVSGIWSKENSPYVINGDIEVEPNSALKINPGVEVVFAGHSKLVVNEFAQLVAIGAPDDSITFTAVNQQVGWNGLRIHSSSNDDTLKYCRFSYGKKKIRANKNEEYKGGAVFVEFSEPTITDCRFLNNEAFEGGAIFFASIDKRFYLDSCFFMGNRSKWNGSAIFIYKSRPWISNSIFHKNFAGYAGTITYAGESNGLGTFYNCRFADNVGAAGSAFKLWGSGNAVISNCLAYNNTGNSVFYNESGNELLLSNCTVVDNQGVGLFSVTANSQRIVNNIFWNNSQELIFLYNNQEPQVSYCNIKSGYAGEGNLDLEPLFIDKKDYQLQSNSPCIDAGHYSKFHSDTDGSRNDMGYYGGNGILVTDTEVDFSSTGISATSSPKIIDWSLFNFRETDLIIENAAFSNPAFKIQNSTFPKNIRANSNDTLSLSFSPNTSGFYTDSLFMQSAGFLNNEGYLPVNGVGVDDTSIGGDMIGVLSVDNSPYLAVNDLHVPENEELIIEAGVVIKFMPSISFLIEGNLRVQGTAQDTVIFTCASDTGYWGRFQFGTRSGHGQNYGVQADYLVVEKGEGLAMYWKSNRPKVFNNCIFRNNEHLETGFRGATLIVTRPDVTFNNCKILNNKGITNFEISYGNVNFRNCLFLGNESEANGALFIYRANVNLINSLFAKNRSVFDNPSRKFAGGITVKSGDSDGVFANLTIVNSIIRGNKPHQIRSVDGFGKIGGANKIIVLFSNIEGGQEGIIRTDETEVEWMEGNIDLDPVIADSLYHLGETSPCINAGNPDTTGLSLPFTDLDGRQRIWNGRVDMGCYEYGAPFGNLAPIITELPDSLTFLNSSSASVNVWNYVEDAETPDSLLVFEFKTDNDSLKTSFNDTTGLLTLTAADFTGFAHLFLSVKDQQNAIASDSIVVDVIAANTPPRFVGLPDSIVIEQASTENIRIWNYVEDVETPDSLLVFEFKTDNDSLRTSFNDTTGFLTFTAADFTGFAHLFLSATDQQNAIASDSIVVDVIAANTPPRFVGLPDSMTIEQSSTESIKIWDYVEDAETPDSLLTYEFSTDCDSLLLDFNEKDGELILSAPSFTGAAMLYLKVTDEANVTIEDSILVLIDTISSVENSLLRIPEDFVLYQNYPNPFNPTTNIRFGMPEASEVTIQVYNILGQKIMTLLDVKKQAGYHEVVLDGRGLGSGIYIYIMKTESFRRVRKMLLVK